MARLRHRPEPGHAAGRARAGRIGPAPELAAGKRHQAQRPGALGLRRGADVSRPLDKPLGGGRDEGRIGPLQRRRTAVGQGGQGRRGVARNAFAGRPTSGRSLSDTRATENAATCGRSVQRHDRDTDAMPAVATGRADADVVNLNGAQHAAMQTPRPRVAHRIRSECDLGLGVRKDALALREAVANAVECMGRDGTCRALLKQWFRERPEPPCAMMKAFIRLGSASPEDHDPTPRLPVCGGAGRTARRPPPHARDRSTRGSGRATGGRARPRPRRGAFRPPLPLGAPPRIFEER